MTDYKQLCAELLADYEQHLYRSELAKRARAALAQPEPEGPTNAEIHAVADELLDGDSASRVDFARAVLARWGTPNSAETRRSPGDAPQPVPVSERLPGPEDCDAEGRCWLLTVEDDYPQWRLHTIEGAQPGGAMIWVPVDSSPGVMVDCFYTSHWLPAHALPVPSDD